VTGLPSHASPAAIDEQHKRVDLIVGEKVLQMGPIVKTDDDTWIKVRLSETRPVWGWIPAGSLKEG
jgi:hypothetical protein